MDYHLTTKKDLEFQNIVVISTYLCNISNYPQNSCNTSFVFCINKK